MLHLVVGDAYANCAQPGQAALRHGSDRDEGDRLFLEVLRRLQIVFELPVVGQENGAIIFVHVGGVVGPFRKLRCDDGILVQFEQFVLETRGTDLGIAQRI